MAEIKVLYLSYSFPPINAAASFRALKLTNGLHEHDIHCTVITRNELEEKHVHRNSEKMLVNEIDPRTRVLRARYFSPTVFQPLFAAFGAFKRLIGKKSTGIGTQSDPFIPDHYIEWIPLAFHKALKHARSNGVDIIYASGPPMSMHVLGYMLKLALKVPLVVEYRDMLTDDPYTKSNAFKKLVNKAIEKHVINRASAVVSVSDPIIDDLVRKHGIEGDMKFTAIPSAFDPEDFEKVAPVDDGKKFVLALTTSLYGDRNPETIFSAISLLKKAGKVKPDNFSLDIYGYNPEKQHAPLLETLGITDVVHFKGFVPHSECISAMKGSTYNLDIGESKFDYPTIPYHFWEYIGSGKQVLHLGRRFDYKASFVRNNRLGIVLQIGRPMEAAVLLHTLMVDNERGLKRTVPAGFASKNTWDDRVEMLASVLQQVDGIAKFKPFSLPKPGGVVPGRYSFDDDYVAVYTG